MVGAAGFEPTTTSPPDWCATRLRHAPTHPESSTGSVRAGSEAVGPLRQPTTPLLHALGQARDPSVVVGQLVLGFAREEIDQAALDALAFEQRAFDLAGDRHL